jgi:predicted GNAT family acetyltransferase
MKTDNQNRPFDSRYIIMGMNVVTYASAGEFLNTISELLQTNEARFGLIYGIARRAEADPHYYGKENPWFATVDDGIDISTIAWRTSPFPVGFAWNKGNPEKVVPPLVEAVNRRWPELTGAAGHREITDPFAKHWCESNNVEIQSTMAQRIYSLTTVNDILPSSGRIRLANISDRELITTWIQAFYTDIYGRVPGNLPVTTIADRTDEGDIFIWEDDHNPVSMTIKGRPTEHSVAITTVYTPPEFRRYGYATACVAAVCREILDNGYDFCTLYTDLSNPTSNSIYMKIGFQSVCDSVEYTFGKPSV